MIDKVRAAAGAKRDADFQIIARTDAVAVEGFEPAVERARAYEAAGTDLLFPEALTSREMFSEFRGRVKAPLLANMTEFGKSPWIGDDDFAAMGYALVIHPATTFCLAARAIKDALIEMKQHGNQETLVQNGKLMPRDEIDGYLIPNL